MVRGITGMGEVKVKVKLTNPMDVAMVREGFKRPEEIRSLEVEALVDTGAVNCVLPQFIADGLGLARPFRQVAQYADGRQEAVDTTEPVLIEILGRQVYEETLVLGDEVLIGQTALEKTDLLINCREQKLIPNPAHPNQPVIKIR
jgi:clan AA aspartic protease